MFLIDADALDELLAKVILHPYGKVTDATKAEHRALCWVAERLEEQPTVDAIPVQWLEDRASRLGLAEMDAVYRLIEEWKKENRHYDES